MARTPIIAGNWKMNKGTAFEARLLTSELQETLGEIHGVDVVLCPPYTVIGVVQEALGDASVIAVAAQDVFWKASGAYTGQISAGMLADAGVRYALVGHSETRGRFGVEEPDFTPDILKHFGETDTSVNRKVHALLAAGLTPIVCVGETLTEHENGHTDGVVQAQIEGALRDVTGEQAALIVFAYEPVWAIGTGKTCGPDEADRVCGVIRATVSALYSVETGESVRIQYGGSMKPENAADLLSRPNIDGGLIGGASLKAADFAAIVRVVAATPNT